jgi:hypothetical protein
VLTIVLLEDVIGEVRTKHFGILVRLVSPLKEGGVEARGRT